ncbi:MAG: hypothetical protein Phog2KO_15130 [Phototrophicaceae bacterium]
MFLLSACSDLAGDVEIAVTVTPSTSDTVADANIALPESQPDIANGARIYQQNCTSCHGETGAGDGALVENGDVPRMGSFLDPVHMRQQSPEFYYDIISNGNLVNLMPPWEGSLSVQERWDVAMYAYTLHYTPEQIALGEELADNPSSELQLAGDTDLIPETGLTGEDAYALLAYQRILSVENWGQTDPEATEVPEISLETANFAGVVTQGSPNATLPTDIMIQLQYGDFLDVAEVVDATLGAEGQFSFADVPVLSNSTYFAVAFYDGRAFLSEPLTTSDLQADNTVDITLYETTSAPNIVNLSSMELVLDYLNVPDLGTGIVTNQLNLYENPTDYVFHLSPAGQDVRISLLISLPIGAVILDAPDRNFIAVQDEYAIIDTRPIYPGTHTVETSYFLPYISDAQTVDILVNNRFEGEVSIILAETELDIVSDIFVFDEEINIGSEEAPLIAKVYRGMVDLQPGESLVFDVEGSIGANTSDNSNVVTQDQLLPILAVVGVVMIVLVIAVMVFLRSSNNKPQQAIDRIISEISQLEDLHEAGRINHDAFQQKRAELKQQLAQLMAETNQE